MVNFNIENAFKAIHKDGKQIVYSRYGIADPTNGSGHLQGIQKLNANHLVISGSSDQTPYFFVVKIDDWSDYQQDKGFNGKIIRCVRIAEDFLDLCIAKKYNHAGGFQILDNILAVGLENSDLEEDSSSMIVFYNLQDPAHPVPVSNTILRPTKGNTAGAVGFIQLPDGNRLLSVGGWDCKVIDFYVLDKNYKCLSTKKWELKNANKSNWKPDKNWGKYQSLNLIQGTDGFYFIGFNLNNSKNWADLFKFNFDALSAEDMITKRANLHVTSTEYTLSFLYGAGIAVDIGSHKGLNLLATQKHWYPNEMRINIFGQ